MPAPARPRAACQKQLFGLNPRVNFTTGDFESINRLQVSLSGFRSLGRGR